MGPPWLIGGYVPKRWALTGSLRPVVYAKRIDRARSLAGQDNRALCSRYALRSPSGLFATWLTLSLRPSLCLFRS